MISKDTTQRYEPDCSTCAHRVERHPSRHSDPSKPRSLNYVCLVCAKAIGEHGTWMHTVSDPETGRACGGPERWVQDVPCKAYDKKAGKWFALDHETV